MGSSMIECGQITRHEMIERMADGFLDAEALRDLEAHLESCRVCQTRRTHVQREISVVREATALASVRGLRSPRPTWIRLVPLAAAALLLGILGLMHHDRTPLKTAATLPEPAPPLAQAKVSPTAEMRRPQPFITTTYSTSRDVGPDFTGLLEAAEWVVEVDALDVVTMAPCGARATCAVKEVLYGDPQGLPPTLRIEACIFPSEALRSFLSETSRPHASEFKKGLSYLALLRKGNDTLRLASAGFYGADHAALFGSQEEKIWIYSSNDGSPIIKDYKGLKASLAHALSFRKDLESLAWDKREPLYVRGIQDQDPFVAAYLLDSYARRCAFWEWHHPDPTRSNEPSTEGSRMIWIPGTDAIGEKQQPPLPKVDALLADLMVSHRPTLDRQTLAMILFNNKFRNYPIWIKGFSFGGVGRWAYPYLRDLAQHPPEGDRNRLRDALREGAQAEDACERYLSSGLLYLLGDPSKLHQIAEQKPDHNRWLFGGPASSAREYRLWPPLEFLSSLSGTRFGSLEEAERWISEQAP